MLDWSQEWKVNLNADKYKVYPFRLGLTTALGNLPSSLATRKFGLTSLHVSSVSFWTEVLNSMRVWRNKLLPYHRVSVLSEPQHIHPGAGVVPLRRFQNGSFGSPLLTFLVWNVSKIVLLDSLLASWCLNHWKPWASKLTFTFTTHVVTDWSRELNKRNCTSPMVIQNMLL